jgi:Holliday junction resolvase
MRNNFESLLVRSLRHYYTDNHINAFVERRPQTRYRKQYIDIIVDSAEAGYLAIECKSTSGKYLNFLSNFHTVEDGLNHVHQVETISYYLNKTGRVGYLAVELKMKGREGNKCYFLPWGDVLARFNNGSKGYNVKEIKQYPRCVKDKQTKLYDVAAIFA